ncbi:MAG: hypothetical protein WB763_18315 [Terriglobia bacterium]|jgi:hypothetical protein
MSRDWPDFGFDAFGCGFAYGYWPGQIVAMPVKSVRGGDPEEGFVCCADVVRIL